MLGIIWTILKIILLIIGIILGIVLLLLSVLLFAPIKYNAFAEKDESTDVKGKISWLFGMIRAEYKDNELMLKYPFKKKEKEPEPTEDRAVYIQQLSEENIEEEKAKEQSTAIEIDEPVNEAPEPEKKKTGIREKIQNIVNFVKRKIYGIKELISRLKDYKKLISDISGRYDIRGITEKTFVLIKKLFKNIGFKVFEINGIIGFEDPDMTGKVLGVLAAADCIIPADLDIDGDFENKRLEGSLILSGKTNIFKLLFPIVVYLLRKPVRPVVIDYIRGDKNE